ncbi:MAG TPA: PEP-CTERM sorting domain-containing protein [Gemmataceae bacterium]|nr:PEP-CTERM sorting domain-containing protein [Gemmataceae bacterium]
MMAGNDRRPRKWPILFASVIAMAAMASTCKADVLVSSLDDEASTTSPATKGFTPASPALEDHPSESVRDSQFNRLALLTTIMFFPPGGGSGGGGGGGTGGGSGGGTHTGSEAPEPATILTGLVGSGLLGMYSMMRRRRAG